MKQIRAQIEDTTSDYDREKLQERLAKLVGGVAIIKVGAATETEMKEKKARVEDAMHATKAAVEEGIVPGGGVALIRASKVLKDLKLGGDQQIGVNIVARAIEEPMRWIATNAGHEGSIVVQKVREMKESEGFNALTDTYEDLVKAGVIDPAKVVRSALQNFVVHRVTPSDHRSDDLRDSRGEEGSADARRRRWRHGRNTEAHGLGLEAHGLRVKLGRLRKRPGRRNRPGLSYFRPLALSPSEP